jgi:hypothetical protein
MSRKKKKLLGQDGIRGGVFSFFSLQSSLAYRLRDRRFLAGQSVNGSQGKKKRLEFPARLDLPTYYQSTGMGKYP